MDRLQPTFVPPFNTGIVNGYKALTGANVKLGKWEEYLAIRTGILRLNIDYRDLLSNDFGAIAGLLFDIGSGRYIAPPRDGDSNATDIWQMDLMRVREESAAAQKLMIQANERDRTHTEVQGWLRDLGLSLGFQVWVASNDQNRAFGKGRLCDGCLAELPLPVATAPGAEAVRLIDILWLEHGNHRVAAAFEVEHTTSIYSGIVRLLDLAFGAVDETVKRLFLVAPDDREEEVRSQLRRPAFRHIAGLNVRFISYGDLDESRRAIERFGQGLKAIHAIARSLS